MNEDTINALLNTISKTMENIPQERQPFYVYSWMLEKFPNEVQNIANNMFNGEVVVVPKNYEVE